MKNIKIFAGCSSLMVAFFLTACSTNTVNEEHTHLSSSKTEALMKSCKIKIKQEIVDKTWVIKWVEDASPEHITTGTKFNFSLNESNKIGSVTVEKIGLVNGKPAVIGTHVNPEGTTIDCKKHKKDKIVELSFNLVEVGNAEHTHKAELLLDMGHETRSDLTSSYFKFNICEGESSHCLLHGIGGGEPN